MSIRIISLVVLAFAALVVISLQATQTHTRTMYLPSELAIEKSINRVRLAGRVVDGSIDYQVVPDLKLAFKVHDPKGDKPGEIRVLYKGVKPDMFTGGRDVLLEGSYNNELLTAETLQTQCPSKYEPPKPH